MFFWTPSSPEDQALQRSFQKLAAAAINCHNHWWVFGGSAARLYGLDMPTADIDVLTSSHDIKPLVSALNGQMLSKDASALFKSEYFGVVRDDVLIEIMSGLEVCSRNVWTSVQFKTREPVNIGEGIVYVPSREELIDTYRLFGRERDLVKAEMLTKL